MTRPFLTAEWRHLLMLNYGVESSLLIPHVPAGVEVDLYEGRALVSLVGFRFLNTRVLGLPIPFHRNFDELNLRFYVIRHVSGEQPRRGVCFIREFVPRLAIALVARTLYDEPYLAVPMGHQLTLDGPASQVSYSIMHRGAWHRLCGRPTGAPILATDDPAIAFITEHYWGYTDRGSGRTSEYQVAHPTWLARKVEDARFDGNGGALYGAKWGRALADAPHSAFLADGSPVAVMPGRGM